MNRFLIYTNRHKDPGMAVTERIRRYLMERGSQVLVETEGVDGRVEADCIIVLGGDGTVLRAARETRDLHIPLIGVNLGTLGYMTEIEPDHLEEALDRLCGGDYEREGRMMLYGEAGAPLEKRANCRLRGEVNARHERGAESHLEGGGNASLLGRGWALNDIVIARRGALRILRFHVYVNGQFLNAYSADGMIVTTPTGSTGYNLSAGGPLVDPKAKLILLTPICPHTLNQRSIILSAEDVVEIEIPQGTDGGEQTLEASFDGGQGIALRTGDRIRIAQSEKVTEFIRLNRVSFLERLRGKL